MSEESSGTLVNFGKVLDYFLLNNYALDVEATKNKSDYELEGIINVISNEVRQVIDDKTMTAEEFNQSTVRQNRDVQALILLFNLGFLSDYVNPLNRFIDSSYKNDINPYWPFFQKIPYPEGTEFKKFKRKLLDEERWFVVEYKGKKGSWYSGRPIGFTEVIKVQGKNNVEPINMPESCPAARVLVAQMVTEEAERRWDKRRILEREKKFNYKKFYYFGSNSTVASYIVVSKMGEFQRGQSISKAQVENVTKLDNIAKLVVVVEEFEAEVFYEDKKRNNSRKKRNFKVGEFLYQILQPIRENEKNLFILYTEQKKISKDGNRKIIELRQKDLEKIGTIPASESSNMFFCQEKNNGKVVARVPATLFLTRWIPPAVLLMTYVGWCFNPYTFVQQYNEAEILNKLGGIWTYAKSWDLVPKSLRRIEKAFRYRDFETILFVIDSLGIPQLTSLTTILADILKDVIPRKVTAGTVLGLQIYSYYQFVVDRLKSFKKLVLKYWKWGVLFLLGLSIGPVVRDFISKIFYASGFISRCSIVVKAVGNTLESLVENIKAMIEIITEKVLNNDNKAWQFVLRCFLIISYLVIFLNFYRKQICSDLLRETGQASNVRKRKKEDAELGKKKARTEMELLAEQTLRLKF